MQGYADYKDSGVDWLEEIPAEWELTKLGSCLSPFSEKNHPDLPLLSITRELGVIERDVENQDTNHNYIPDDLSGYKLLKKGQFGMNKMKAWQGSYGVSPFTGIVSPAYFMFDFTKEIDPDFFHVAIRSKLYVSFFGSASDGVRIGQWDLSKPRMKEIPLALPPLPEQTAIADFLDDKTAKIDDLARIKQRQIELLAERKKILIQNAVTKGLNPDAPMKDSVIDWIGEIPAHWEVKPAKHLFSEVDERSENGDEELLSVSHLTGVTPRSEKTVSMFLAEDYSGSKICVEGDLVFNIMWAWMGALGVSAQLGIVSPSYAVFRQLKSQTFNPVYLEMLVQSLGYIEHYNKVSTGLHSSRLRFYSHMFLSMKIGYPSFEEQEHIVQFLAKETGKISKAISVLENQIIKLNEYKTTLINAAVTGKIKVA